MKKMLSVVVLLTLLCLYPVIGNAEADNAIGKGSVLRNGIYYIAAAADSNAVFDVSSASLENGAKIILYNRGVEAHRQFYVTHKGYGQYEIRAMHSGKALDINQASKKQGIQLQQWDPNNTSAQRFYLERDRSSADTYRIRPKCTKMYLDAKGGTTANGTIIWTYTKNNSFAQKFKFIEVPQKEVVPGFPSIISIDAPKEDGKSLTKLKWGTALGADCFDIEIRDAYTDKLIHKVWNVPVKSSKTKEYSAYTNSLPSGHYSARVSAYNRTSRNFRFSPPKEFVVKKSDGTIPPSINDKLAQLRKKYPSGSKWNGYFGGGWQCYGFARLIAKEATGSHPENIDVYNDGGTRLDNWLCYKNENAKQSIWGGGNGIKGIKKGDYIRYYTDQGGHSIYILNVTHDTIYSAECDGSNGNVVKWDVARSKDSIVSKIWGNRYGVLIDPINQ